MEIDKEGNRSLFYVIIGKECLGERDEKRLINWLLSHNRSNRNVDST